MPEASIELLAPRADVWAFLAEPYHLPDWWPGLTGVEPDRRGLAPGARWKAHVSRRNWFTGPRNAETTILITAVAPFERLAFHVLATKQDAEVRLQAVGEDRTLATVVASSGNARLAAKRLYDLIQTAATL